MILAAVNLYSPLLYLVLAISCKAGQSAILRPHRGEAMQYRGYELLRIPLPRTPLNKAKNKGRVQQPRPFFSNLRPNHLRLGAITFLGHAARVRAHLRPRVRTVEATLLASVFCKVISLLVVARRLLSATGLGALDGVVVVEDEAAEIRSIGGLLAGSVFV